MKVLICLLALIAILLAAEAAHAYHGTSFPCSLRVQGTILPVYYDGSPRNNPDGTFYPGDSFYYLVSYSAGPQCRGLHTHEIRHTDGLEIGLHVSGPPRPGRVGDDGYTDPDSVDRIRNVIESRCERGGQYSGCFFGKATVSGDAGFSCTGSDPCVDRTEHVEQSVTAIKKVCTSGDGGIRCRNVPVTRTAVMTPPVLKPSLDVILTREILHDADGYEARNLDGTYYLWDPVTVLHVQQFRWKDHRANTIHFETDRSTNLHTEAALECGENSCDMTLEHSGLAASRWRLGNGDGVTIYNATGEPHLGRAEIDYDVRVYNNGELLLDYNEEETDALIVLYLPQYTEYPYSLLSDDMRTSYQNRASVALHYFGSLGGGPDDAELLHEDRRSKINDFAYAGFGLDPWHPVAFNETLSWSEAVDVGVIPYSGGHDHGLSPSSHPGIIPCMTKEHGTAMMKKSGYCKIHFDYPILDTVTGPSGPRYENATLFNTLISHDFAGRHDTYLSHYEYRFAEPFLHTMLRVESVGAGGSADNTPVTVDIGPAGDVQTIPEYLHEKVTHDTGDAGLGIIVSNDTHPIQYSASGQGAVDVKLRRVSSEFGRYPIEGGQDVAGRGIADLAPLYLANSRDARLEVPLDVGLGSPSPLSVNVTAGGMTRQYEYDYMSFGSNITISANLAQDNVLEASREHGHVTVTAPPEFGRIERLYLDGQDADVDCGVSCIINVQDDSAIRVTAENGWGGTAHATVQEFVPEEPRRLVPEHVVPLALFALAMIPAYLVYDRIKNRR